MLKHQYTDSIQFLKTLTLKKIANSTVLRVGFLLSKISGKYIHWGKPESLSVEPTNLCNLKCPECPSGTDNLNRPRLFLPYSKYKEVIDESGPWLVYLQLFFQGEPFMHPKIYDFISYAAQKNIYTSTSTNGQFLSQENSLKVVQSRLSRIIISIDGITQESYEKYRVGGSLDLAINSIKNIRKARNKLKIKTPLIIVQFVVFRSNEHEVTRIKKLSRDWGADTFEIKTAQFENFENGNVEMPENRAFSRYRKGENGKYYLNRKKNFKCRRIWNSAVISAEKQVLPCCFDKQGKYNYTEAKDILSSWKSNQAVNFRKKVWAKPGSIDICKNCTEGIKKVYVK